MDELETEIAELICDVCRIRGGIPLDMTPDSYLIGPESPLDTDSLDAVEIVFSIQNKYGVRIGNDDNSRKILATLKSLAGFVREDRTV